MSKCIYIYSRHRSTTPKEEKELAGLVTYITFGGGGGDACGGVTFRVSVSDDVMLLPYRSPFFGKSLPIRPYSFSEAMEMGEMHIESHTLLPQHLFDRVEAVNVPDYCAMIKYLSRKGIVERKKSESLMCASPYKFRFVEDGTDFYEVDSLGTSHHISLTQRVQDEYWRVAAE